MENKRIEILEKIFIERRKKGKHEVKALETPNLKKIRETTPTYRKSKMLKQRELAEELGIETGSLIDIEKGKAKLKFEYALKISYLYNVSIDYIYGLTDLPREEMREAKFTKKILKIDGNTKIKKTDENGKTKEAQELILTIDKDALKCLIDFRKLEDDKKANEISQEEYEILNAKIEQEYEKILNDMYKQYYCNDTIKFALISVDEIKKLSIEEQDILLRVYPFIMPPDDEENFLKINGKKYKYSKENLVKYGKELLENK